MNILFLSIAKYDSISSRGIYSDLLRHFISNGDYVYMISPIERRDKKKEYVTNENKSVIVHINIFNMQKTNTLEKGLSMITIDYLYKSAIKKYFPNIKFDLVIYPTPPITLLKSIKYVKKRDNSITYLLLKDIFPQNALDIGIMTDKGIFSIVYKYFRLKEKQLYESSDYIGCMSEANVDYLLSHNEQINQSKVEVCPNSIDPIDLSCSELNRNSIRVKYNIPLNKTVFIYGGNLGKPQGIDYLISCLKKCNNINDVYFLIVGSGTEYEKLANYIVEYNPSNVKLMQAIPKEDYDVLVGSCDVGMIFLDHRFTIPNFPSRLLAYMQARMPVLACTDINTDIGRVIVNAGFGWWCESNNSDAFCRLVNQIKGSNFKMMGGRAYDYLERNYTADLSYKIISAKINKELQK